VANAVGNLNSLKDSTILVLWALGTDAAQNTKYKITLQAGGTDP
jgi:hypothetical protein